MPETTDAQAQITSFDPATGQALGSVPILGQLDVEAAVARAHQAFIGWRDLGFEGRQPHLLRWRDALAARRDELARLITLENGKPLVESLQEVLSACEFLAYYARQARRLLHDERVSIWNPVVANRETWVVYEPKGVVAVISPWNYPLLLTMAEASGALAVGNTVLLKPSELTPLLGVRLAEIAREAGLPDGVLQVLTGDGTTGAALAAAQVDHVCFTGSVATGRKVAKSAMDRLVPVTLELGGKDSAVVLPDADLDFTAQGLVWGAFTNAGQACASVERAYVPRAIAPALIEKVLARTAALRVGSGLDADTEVGPVISEAQLARIENQIADAVARGARVLTGGHRLDRPGTFFAPTVISGVTSEMLLMREETFGPVLPLIEVDDADAMLRLTNDSPFGLSASIWTRDLEAGKRLARRVKAGSIWINTGLASYGTPQVPRGGFKESGIGKIGGRAGLLELVDTKLIDVAASGKVKAWWYPTWPGAYQHFAGGMALLHGRSLRERAAGLWLFLRNRRGGI